MDEEVSPINSIKNTSYRTCFVPLCTNTTLKNPSKLFFTVPKDQKLRKKWFQIANRRDPPTTSRYYCCEDHFDVSIRNFVLAYVDFDK